MALTAFARSEDRRRALLAGFQTHVAKPVDPAELVAVVASLVERTGKPAMTAGRWDMDDPEPRSHGSSALRLRSRSAPTPLPAARGEGDRFPPPLSAWRSANATTVPLSPPGRRCPKGG